MKYFKDLSVFQWLFTMFLLIVPVCDFLDRARGQLGWSVGIATGNLIMFGFWAYRYRLEQSSIYLTHTTELGDIKIAYVQAPLCLIICLTPIFFGSVLAMILGLATLIAGLIIYRQLYQILHPETSIPKV